MKSLYTLIFFLLLTFSFCTITFDLTSGQSKEAGSNVAISLTATNDDTQNSVTFTAVSGLNLTDGTNQVEIDCSGISSTIVAESSSSTISCTLASISAGSYTLNSALTPKITVDNQETDAAASNTNSLTVTSTQQQQQEQQTGITIDVKSSQSVNTGSNIGVKLTLSSTAAATVKTLTGLSLVKTDNSSVTVALTCSATTAVEIEASGSSDFSCTAATLSTAGTYKLTGTDLAGTDSSNAALSVSLSVTGTNTITVTTPSSSDDEESSKFLTLSSLFILFLFF